MSQYIDFQPISLFSSLCDPPPPTASCLHVLSFFRLSQLAALIGIPYCGHFRSVILYWGQFCLLRDIWQYLENFCLSQLGEKVLIVSGKQKAGMLLNVLQCTGRPSQQTIIWPQRSLVPRFRPCFRLYISFFHSEPLSALSSTSFWSHLFTLVFSLVLSVLMSI